MADPGKKQLAAAARDDTVMAFTGGHVHDDTAILAIHVPAREPGLTRDVPSDSKPPRSTVDVRSRH